MADQHQPMPIAIVGMSCRLPGKVSTPSDLYRMICRKRAGWSQVPADRFTAEAYQHPNPDKKGSFNSKGGYFLQEDISMFDAGFFDITKKEAESMDPAQRLLLECAYEALENAGAPKESVSGKKVGVFVGGNYSEHRVANLRDLDHIPVFDATGNQGAFLAGRLAYYFNLRGPTFTVDTACSSSMHALHLAVQSIRAGESDQAIVGASHLITDPDIWVSMAKLRLFSEEGKTYAFDDRAKSGYARGEGAGCLILKPLAQAQADNDHIYSVITHTGINHNGRTVGIVAPSPDEQESLLKRVFAEANINPCDIGFFEAHGTGTKKGDPIEAQAIHKAVGSHFTRQDPLHIGSVKANVGHLECASGVVSVIKGVLMLYYGFILPNADFQRVNEAIPMDEYKMRVATAQKPWPAKRKYVCVNNFGFSGSNSTCVLSAAPQLRGLEVADNGCYSPLRLFVVSANDEAAVRNSVTRLGVWIEQHAELYQTTMPRNLSYTLCQRRSHLPWRVAVVASMCSEVASALNSHEAVPMRAPAEPPRLAFVYTGQGAQWHAMGRELLRTHPVFHDAANRADETLQAIGADFSLLEELQRDKESSRVGLAHISQAVCSAVQLALTDLFASFGVRPAAVTGHSSGEIAAAYAAGALTFESAVAAAYYRGQVIVELQENHPNLRGSMMAVGAGAEALNPMLSELNRQGGPQAVVACENSPSSTTLSGDEEAIDRVAAMFEDKGVFNRKLFVNVAYHSPHMKLLAESYLKKVSHIEAPSGMASSEVVFFSSLHGRRISLVELGPQYWVDNLTQTVRFSSALKGLCTDKEFKPDILIEVGPHAALKGPIMQTLKTLGPSANNISYLPTLVRGENATRTCLHMAGQLFVRGCRLNFFEINHHREEAEQPELVPFMYTYPWSRQSYWYESRLVHQHRVKPFARNDLLGTLADWSTGLEPTWRNVIRTEDLPWLKNYLVQSRMVFPVAAFISMIMEAAVQTATLHRLDPGRLRFEIKNFAISDHLFLDDGQEYEVLVTFHHLKAKDTREHEFHISSYEAGRDWLEHCTGTVTATDVQEWSVCSTPAEGTAGSKEEALIDSACESSTSLDDGSPDSLTTPSSSFSTDSSANDSDGLKTPDMLESLGNHLPGPSSNLEHLACSQTDVYQRLASRNLSYPESFRSLVGIMANETKMVAQGLMHSTASEMPNQHETQYEIHPSLIDSMLQLPLLRLQAADEATETAYLPSSASHIILRPQRGQNWQPGSKFGVVAAAEPRSTAFMAELLPAPASASPEAAMSIAGIEYKALESATQQATLPRELCYDVTWEPLNAPDFSSIEKTVRERGRAGVTIATVDEIDLSDPLVISLAREIEVHVGVEPRICPLEDVENFGGFFIVLREAQFPLPTRWDPIDIRQTRYMLTKAAGLMWVTKGAALYTCEPAGNLGLGLVRTARSERSAVASTLDLSPKSKLTAPQQAALIKDAFVLSVLSDNEGAEMEFAEIAGGLVVPRIVPNQRLNLEVHRSLGASAPYEQDFRRPGRRLSLASISAQGSSDELYFEDVPDTPLGDDEVEVEVVASALSLQDGIAPWTPDRGKRRIPRSCSGYVTRRVGKDGKVTNVAKEDRVPVCVLTEGPLGTHVRARATSIAEIPESLDMKTAACIPGPFLAAYHALTKVAVVQENERVLVQLSGPAGVAGLVVAEWLGANIFALVQNLVQEGVAAKYGIPPERILHANSIYLRGQLEEATQGNGMDVVLALSGHAAARAWECLGNFGRFVEIRTPGEHARTKPELGVNASFTSVNVNSIAEERPKLLQESLGAVVRVIENGAITLPDLGYVVPVSQLADGLRMVREGAVESVVALAGENQQVKALHKLPEPIFRPDGTHLIIGGTGGLGRSLAKYMIEHGARNIVLLSRRDGANGSVQRLMDEAGRRGARIEVVKCDASSRKQAFRLIEDWAETGLPPICGVIHAAMVLRDVLLENMTYQDFHQVVSPKVYGAWNMHTAMETYRIFVDYFVVLSSAAGILGSRGQAAYAAANTSLDSLARYRDYLGLRSTSLDLTAVMGAGYLAENEERQGEVIRNFGNETISEDEVLALVSAAVRGVCGPQCLTGLKLHLDGGGQWPYYANDARFSRLKAECLAAAEKEGRMPKHAVSPGNAFRAAKSDQEARDIAAQGIIQKLFQVLTIAVEDLDVARNITSYGLDSLTAIELRNWIAKELRANLQILELLSGGTINDLAALIVQKTRGP